ASPYFFFLLHTLPGLPFLARGTGGRERGRILSGGFMSKTTLFCPDLPNIPWQDKPAGCAAPLWRYSENPVIRRNPLPGVARIFNSAVMPYQGAFIGVFRGEQTNG